MGRYKCQGKVSRYRVVTGKQDTPVKPALSRRNKFRKLSPIKHHEAIQEEPDHNVPTVKSAYPILTSFKPIPSESALHWRSPAVTAEGNTSSPATPAFVKSGSRVSPATQITLNPKVLTCFMTPDQEKMPVRPESLTSPSPESEMTLSSDDDDDDDWCSSSSSLPSPEIFRRESCVETLHFTGMEEHHHGHHPYRKNSTLLDVSHAGSIHMYHPPNLSTIIDAPSILTEKKCNINPLLDPEVETKFKTISLKPVKPSLNSGTKTPPKLTNRRPISYKKKVWFKSPVICGTFEAKHTPADEVTPHTTTEPVRTACLAEENKPDADTSRAGESSFKEEKLRLRVSLKRPEERSTETATFFDFDTESDNDKFFEMMRERSARLRSLPLFPLTAARHTTVFHPVTSKKNMCI